MTASNDLAASLSMRSLLTSSALAAQLRDIPITSFTPAARAGHLLRELGDVAAALRVLEQLEAVPAADVEAMRTYLSLVRAEEQR